jgi:hypothetical protein
LATVFAGYPLTFPTAPVGTTILTASTPLGLAYWAGNGGGYFVPSAVSTSVSWLSTSGTWSSNVFSDSNVAYASFTNYGVTVWSYSSTQDVLLVVRTNAAVVPPTAALTAYDLAAATFGAKLWTIDLGVGFAKDVAVDSSDYAYVTDAKFGKIWEVDLTLAAPTTFGFFTNNTAWFPSSPASMFSQGISGVRAVSSSYIVVGVNDPGVSRDRLYCVSTTDGSATALTFTNAAAFPLLPATGIDGLDFYPTGELGFSGAPAVVGIITPVGGDFCSSGVTYTITKLENVTAAFVTGNIFTATAWNCDFEIMTSLGTSYAAVTTPVGTNPATYAIWVNNGTLPYVPVVAGVIPAQFNAGWDCSTAIPVIPGAAIPSQFYDMLCFQGSRVSIPSGSCGRAFGIWFKINVTGMTGSYDFTTRTTGTGFDNYLSLYSVCPTYCNSVPNDPSISCTDDAGSFAGGCSASSTSYCSAINVPDVSIYKEIYAVVNFYSSPTIAACSTDSSSQPNYFTTFGVVPGGGTPVSPLTPFPTRICDPCNQQPSPTPSPTPAPGDGSGSGGTDSASASSVF